LAWRLLGLLFEKLGAFSNLLVTLILCHITGGQGKESNLSCVAVTSGFVRKMLFSITEDNFVLHMNIAMICSKYKLI
jgi:hypothetical protein